jgi:NitT/TauT family transport system substrate-binding protein
MLTLFLLTSFASAQSKLKVTIAVGGGACLCYIPTMLAKALGE